ncbi:MAG: hypothetical protein HY898_10020 [Deltaproteobacteria bacterium]|nr:hypothetical protein [Deltaproteobacteria bacterium]
MGRGLALAALCAIGACAVNFDEYVGPPEQLGKKDGATGGSTPDGPDGDLDSFSDASGCMPKTCAQLGATCGSAPDGCGWITACGDCKSGETCGGGGPNQCGTGSCVAKTCAQLGASCGYVSDTCGLAIDCGECPAGQACGAGGVDNQCECECKRSHASTTCSGNVCTIQSCEAGWDDCDGDEANGCEADLAVDESHCGSCPNACTGDACNSAGCSSGSCTQNPLPDGTGCGANHVCQGGSCVSCGGNGQACCAGGCNAGLECDASVCEPCGGESQPCCAGNGCDAGLGCLFGKCVCGVGGFPCCGGSGCLSPTVCQGGTCVDCTPKRQPCSAQTCCSPYVCGTTSLGKICCGNWGASCVDSKECCGSGWCCDVGGGDKRCRNQNCT